MPPDSTDRLLIAPVRAARISRRQLTLASCQEPVRRPPDHTTSRTSRTSGPLDH